MDIYNLLNGKHLSMRNQQKLIWLQQYLSKKQQKVVKVSYDRTVLVTTDIVKVTKKVCKVTTVTAG